MAHDLGHPPFGHIAEEELDARLRDVKESDGYEGNAQSFRIVTRLETRESGREKGSLGLNLTRATLNALLKYPRMRSQESVNGHEKFGAYRSETAQFEFARKQSTGDSPCLEAQIMDWADDITYAVHDLEDFYRARMIPLDRLSKSKDEIKSFLTAMVSRLKGKIKPEEEQSYEDAATRFLSFCPVSEAYSGRRTQQVALRGFASSIIHDAICGATLCETGLVRPAKSDREVTILKQLTWHYVIEDSRLATEHHGQRTVIGRLFKIFSDAAAERAKWKIFPPALQEQLQDQTSSPARTAADYIASMGERRALDLYCELMGTSLKPVTTGAAL